MASEHLKDLPPLKHESNTHFYTDTKWFFSQMMDKARDAEVSARDGIMAAISLGYLNGERKVAETHITVNISLPELIKQAALERRNQRVQSLA